jgi:hypothetical protein
MKLLTKEIRRKIPKLYEQEGKGEDAIAYVKFFDPCGSWTWYATEGEPVIDEDTDIEVDFRFFGLVYGHEKELGYFVLSELASYRGPFGLGIERDKWFRPKPLKECKDPCGRHS